jgi:selenocysteine lyase/cysteine desulfurase
MSEWLDFEALLADEDLRRREFPVTGRVVYLAHAAVGPLPARVAAAIAGYAVRAAEAGQFEHLHKPSEDSARSMAAAMLGASAEEIAFVPSTSAGLSLVAAGLPWREGDNVVIADGDFPANVYPWLGLKRRGDARPMGITSFHDPAEDMAALHKRLLAEGIIVSLRADPAGRSMIRAAPHFYSTEGEIQALLKALRR